MAARRLAISSLLCEDNLAGTPVAAPSHSPSPSRPTSEFVDSSPYSASTHNVNRTISSSSLPNSESSKPFQPTTLVSPPGPIPIPRYNERHGSRSPIRRTRAEMVLDDERGVSDASRPDSVPHDYAFSTSHHTRRQSSQLDRQQPSPGNQHHHVQSLPLSECSYPSVRPTPSAGHTVPSQPYSYSYSPSRSLDHPSLSPTHPDTVTSSSLPLTFQHRRVSATSDRRYSSAYMSPIDTRYTSHLSSSSLSIQANSPFRLTPVHPSFSNANSSSSFTTSPQSIQTPPSPRRSPVLSRSYSSATTRSPTMPVSHPSTSSPVSKSPLDGFGPLEALAQAATEERRRLSGDLPKPVWQGSKSPERSPTTSLRAVPTASPVLMTSAPSQSSSYSRSRSPERSPTPQQDHPLESVYGQLSTSPTVSSTRLLPNDSLPEITGAQARSPTHMHDGEPPLKRRRSSNESRQAAKSTSLAQHSPHSPLVRTRAISPVTVFDMRDRQVIPNNAPLPSPKETIQSPPTLNNYHPGVSVSPTIHTGPMSVPMYDASPAVPVPRRTVTQDDAHDWLMQQYSSQSAPGPSGSNLSMNMDHAAATVSHLSTFKSESKSPVPPLVHVQRASTSPPRTGSTSTSKRSRSASTTAKPPRDAALLDADIEMEFSQVASGHTMSPQRQEDNEVDDELLSLLDDKPSSTTAAKTPSTRSPIPPAPEPSRKPTPSQVTSLLKNGPHPHVKSGRSPSVISSPQADRDSMPPPVVPLGNGTTSGKSATAAKSGSGTKASQSKKKEGAATQKGMARTKQASKAKPKGTALKAKAKVGKDSTAEPPAVHPLAQSTTASATTGRGKKGSPAETLGGKRAASTNAAAAVGASSRSRSTSVLPDHNKDVPAEPEEEAPVDDKLYCICKTPYDEDRVMIACDRCDEWYHTQCVHMPDEEVDLVDQFICPVCIKNNPNLTLKTTYKNRCFAGLKHPDPSSPDACHKPARGALSKYCSEACGIAYTRYRIEAWDGDAERLWESVKHAEKRQAVVIRCIASSEVTNGDAKANGHPPAQAVEEKVVPSARPKPQRQLERLNARLDKIGRQREEIKKDLDVVLWRARLFELAVERAEAVNECGWDQRLCFDHEEYAEFGASVFDSYIGEGQKEEEDGMQVDGAVEDGEWWCKGQQKCERHAGWQKLRQAEIEFEKTTMYASLDSLTAQETELRQKIEEVTNPQSVAPASFADIDGMVPLRLKLSPEANGIAKPKVNGTVSKKGKKRKADAL